MLTLVEKILFAIATLALLYFTYQGVMKIVGHISSGQGKVDWSLLPKRIGDLIVKVGFFKPVFRFRLGPSILHAFIGWGFFTFLLVNVSDLIYGYTGWKLFFNTGLFGDIYRLLADFMGVAIMVGMLSLSFRRYVLKPATLTTRDTTLLNPKARTGILRDSAIVTAAFFTHNFMRMLEESFHVAQLGHTDAWQPIISTVSGLWSGMDANSLIIAEHVSWWISIGVVVAFLPYFPYSKHIHLFMAPLNFGL